MGRLSFIVGSSIVLIFLSRAIAIAPTEQPKTIPLNQIWAYDMPGTRKVGELDAVKEPTGVTLSPNVKQVVLALAARRPKQGENVGPAFVVRGTSKQALENARDIITRFIEPGTTLPPETDLTLVFYSVIGGGYVHINAVEKSDHVITVKYRFVNHNTRDDSLHFALIPLGKLPEGKYEVKIEQLESVDTRGGLQEPIREFERFVCHGASFTVGKQKP